MKAPKILVFELFGASLSSREQAEILYRQIKKRSNRVVVDFSRVTFISRSFADQFYKGFLELAKVMIVEVINGSREVADMFNAVSRTQNSGATDCVPYKFQSFVTKQDLREYLYSID